MGRHSMTPRIGAELTDWDAFTALGLTEDLLPVVSDTSLQISPRSRIGKAGKTPSIVNSEGHIVGLSKWTERRTRPNEVKQWAKDGRLGVCLQTREVRAFDVDIGDSTISAQVRGLIELLAGGLPCRWRRNSGKLLLAFRMPGEFKKQQIHTEHGVIEFLATGQQFIAAGTHPSGTRYEWENLGDAIPELSEDEFLAVWQVLSDTYGNGEKVNQARTLTSHDDPVMGMSEDDIRQLLAVLDPVMPYGEWLKVGQAIHHESRGAWCHLWDAWSQDGEYPGADVIEYKWGTFGHSSGAVVTAKTLLHMAGQTDSGKTVAGAVRAAKPEEFPIEVSAPGEPVWPAFTRHKDKIETTISNVTLALDCQDFSGVRFGRDNFKDAVMVAWNCVGQWRPLKDTDYTQVRIQLERRGIKAPGRELVRDAALRVAEQNEFDSALEWGNGLVWDGVPRVDTFMSRYFNTEISPYAMAVGRYMWTALAGRLLTPGEEVHMAVVLVGAQGSGKSRGVRALAPEPDSYVEINLEHRDDNLSRALRGKLVGELGELRGLQTMQGEAIKAWISRSFEEWTPKYMEFATKFPRRLVLIGTTNQDDFLADDTGERRWLPIRVGATDLEGIERDRDQLWAEAMVLYRQAGVQWLDAQALAVEEHSAFKTTDPWSEPVRNWLMQGVMDDMEGPPKGSYPFKTENVMHGALGLDSKAQGIKEQKRVARVLRGLGYVTRRATRAEGGKNIWVAAENCTFAELA